MEVRHVPSLERCKRLKELGIEFPEAHFFYFGTGVHCKRQLDFEWAGAAKEFIPAPLVSEMLTIAATSDLENLCEFLEIKDDFKQWWVAQSVFRACVSPNEIADLLIWLKENKHI